MNTTFVTPFDREDIHALAEELDDVVDDMLEVSHRMQVTGITTALPELKEQADLLVQCAEETPAAGAAARVDEATSSRTSTPSTGSRARATPCTGASSPGCSAASSRRLDVLRWKDVIEAMEGALNTLEDISDVVESIVLKHA